MLRSLSALSFLLAFTLLAVGCFEDGASTAGVDVAAAQKQFVLAAEPADPQTVLDLREQEGGFSEGDVVLVGQVGGMPNPWQDEEANFPWREGQASFFIVDPSTVAEFSGHSHAAGDDHADCVFCQSKAAKSVDSIAGVSFFGADGQPLAVDARKLFDVKENDIVVIKGHAQKLSGDLIVVTATGIYVRK